MYSFPGKKYAVINSERDLQPAGSPAAFWSGGAATNSPRRVWQDIILFLRKREDNLTTYKPLRVCRDEQQKCKRERAKARERDSITARKDAFLITMCNEDIERVIRCEHAPRECTSRKTLNNQVNEG